MKTAFYYKGETNSRPDMGGLQDASFMKTQAWLQRGLHQLQVCQARIFLIKTLLSQELLNLSLHQFSMPNAVQSFLGISDAVYSIKQLLSPEQIPFPVSGYCWFAHQDFAKISSLKWTRGNRITNWHQRVHETCSEGEGHPEQDFKLSPSASLVKKSQCLQELVLC